MFLSNIILTTNARIGSDVCNVTYFCSSLFHHLVLVISIMPRDVPIKHMIGFFIMGLINNFSYVVMLSAAEDLLAGQAGGVLFCDIFPSAALKITAPLWADKLGYNAKIIICTVFAILSFLLSSQMPTTGLKLMGVICASISSGFGEVVMLSFTSFFHPKVVTAWSSGTGFAGIAGAGAYLVMHTLLGWSAKTTLLVSAILPIFYAITYYVCLFPQYKRSISAREERNKPLFDSDISSDQFHNNIDNGQSCGSSAGDMYADPAERLLGELEAGDNDVKLQDSLSTNTKEATTGHLNQNSEYQRDSLMTVDLNMTESTLHDGQTSSIEHTAAADVVAVVDMDISERLQRAKSLLPYMIPLAVVYFAEYLINTGINSTLEFHDMKKADFYVLASFMYQIGVFVSRSSREYFPLERLWPLPVLQMLNVAIFLLQALFGYVTHAWMMVPFILWEGLLGGLAYVNVFALITKNVDKQYLEFSLGTASMADTAGILAASGVALVLESALLKHNE